MGSMLAPSLYICEQKDRVSAVAYLVGVVMRLSMPPVAQVSIKGDKKKKSI